MKDSYHDNIESLCITTEFRTLLAASIFFRQSCRTTQPIVPLLEGAKGRKEEPDWLLQRGDEELSETGEERIVGKKLISTAFPRW